jgi:hypothetical protein
VAGLGGRALLQGAGQLADLPGKLIAGTDWVGKQVADAARTAVGLRPTVTPPMSYGSPVTDAASKLADTLGLPTPATTGERIGSAAVSALPSGVLAPEAPVAGALWGAAGGAASQATAEAGGGPVAQTLAGLAAGGAPLIGAGAAGFTRTLTRGAGDAAAATTAGRIASAADAGVNLNAGQATGSRALQWGTASSGRLWGGSAVAAQAEQQAEALKSHVDRIVDNLSGGVTPSPTTAGEAINTGVATAKQSMRQAEKAAYDKVDALVPADSQVDVSGSLGKLNGLATPTPGAEATTGSLISPTISDLSTNLSNDAANAGGTLPYSSVRAVRTAVGNKIDWGFSPSDPVTNGHLKQVYGVLGDDLNAHASAISPQAEQAVNNASSLYAANQAKRDLLGTIVDKTGGPEAVYQAATNGTKLGATKIGGVMDALDPQNQNTVRATVIDRMGRSIPSQQNAASNAFSADTFLTNWAKMSPEAKDALFGASGSGSSLRRSLDSLEDTASTIRGSMPAKNPSHTAGTLAHGMGLWALLGETAGAVMGHGVAPIATLAGGTVGNMILSRALTNPRTARWLAQTTKLPPQALPNAVNQLEKMSQQTNDPDARDLVSYMAGAGTGAVQVAHPDGRTGTVPASQLNDALAAGYKQLPQVSSAADHARIAPGASYRDPQGNVRTKQAPSKPMPTGAKLSTYASTHFGGDTAKAQAFLSSQGYK